MSTLVPVIVLAKAPRPGLAKTRLVPALGEDGAAALAARLLDHAVAQALAAACGAVWLCGAPDVRDTAFQRHEARVRLAEQGDGDLGVRMHRAFERVLAATPGAAGALLIGSDAPALDASTLRAAAAVLADHDAVFVPAFDGGYALVGLRRVQPALFADLPWSTPQVMALTRERLDRLGLHHAELPAVADIDVPADLVHLPAGWAAA